MALHSNRREVVKSGCHALAILSDIQGQGARIAGADGVKVCASLLGVRHGDVVAVGFGVEGARANTSMSGDFSSPCSSLLFAPLVKATVEVLLLFLWVRFVASQAPVSERFRP